MRNAASSSIAVTDLTPPMDQHHFEFEMYRCLEYGDEQKLARAAGKSAAYYSQMLNPDDPRESLFYRVAQDFRNWICDVNPEGGRKAYLTFCTFIDKDVAECGGHGSLASVHKESSEGVQAGMTEAPIDEQIREAREAIGAWAAHLRTLEAQKLSPIRLVAKQAIGARVNGNGRAR